MSEREKKLAMLDELRRNIIDNNICSNLAEQATQLVMGEGNVDAAIVLIGEAPGKKEDERGVPFVGAAGKFLNEMLLRAGMERNDVYITNIVKYRPPKNRDPSPEEKAAFLPYLLEQLRIIQPSIVITLGRHSMEYFLPNARISDVHGQVIQTEFQGQAMTVVPLYHPAAALYNGSMRQVLIDDFVHIAMILEKQG
ncbi:uracil-DNA glycosylase [Candidatus Saccharibacteria bacterium]|nr:uracil-DNA glycosylase [Candidatus Saccharibacteria bacterium]